MSDKKPTVEDVKWWVNRQIDFHQKDQYGNPNCVPYFKAIRALISQPRTVTREQFDKVFERIWQNTRGMAKESYGKYLERRFADLGIKVEEKP